MFVVLCFGTPEQGPIIILTSSVQLSCLFMCYLVTLYSLLTLLLLKHKLVVFDKKNFLEHCAHKSNVIELAN